MSGATPVARLKKFRLAGVGRILGQPLFANAGYLMGVSLVGSLVGFLFWGLAARLYRPEEVGAASAVLSAVALVSGIAGLGMGMGLVRFLPEARSPGRLLNTAFTFNVVTALVVAGVYLAGLRFWSPSLMVLTRNGLYTVGFLAYAVAATLGTVVRMAFVARRLAGYTLAHTCVVNGGRLVLVVLLAGMGAAGLVGSVALSVLLAVGLSLVFFLPRVEPGYRPRPDLVWTDLAAIIPYSVGNYVAGLLAQTSQMVLPLMILEMLGPASSGHAYVAWMLGGLLASPGVALAGSAFAEGSNAPWQLRSILVRAAGAGLALTVPAALLVGAAAPWALLLFGPSYAQEGAGLLRWLAAAAPLVVLSQIYFTYLRVRKWVGRLILLSGVLAAATLGVSAALLGRFGIAVSGAGWFVGNGLVAAAAVWGVWRDRLSRPREVKAMSRETKREVRPRGRRPVVVAAIPCYNEARFIGDVVRRAREHVDAVVVVDDGSTDGTAEAARAAGAQVVRHEANRGPGAAARTCLEVGREMRADVVVTLDGDGQHNPDEIPEVVSPVLSGEADLVIGSRFMGRYNNVAAYRRFGINVITFLYNMGSSAKITDGQSCFRAYGRRALEVLNITEDGFGFSVETLIQARRAGLRIREVPISCVYHEESHSLNPVIHGVGVAWKVVEHRLRRLLEWDGAGSGG
ncbi:MAG TPA: glycosyltransferase [Thermoflexia bacterium]|nr:glycosyltransferase [Thermoflexia bacterium]